MFIKKEDMKASMAVYMNMIKDGHIEGVKVKKIYTIPAMITKLVSETVMKVANGVPFSVVVYRPVKVPNVKFERELIGYDVVVVAKQKPALFEGIVARPEFHYTFNKQKHHQFMKKCLH